MVATHKHTHHSRELFRKTGKPFIFHTNCKLENDKQQASISLSLYLNFGSVYLRFPIRLLFARTEKNDVQLFIRCCHHFALCFNSLWCCCVVVWAEAISIQTKTPSSTLFDGSWASMAHFNIHKQHNNNTKKTSEEPFITLCAEASLSTWLEAARSSAVEWDGQLWHPATAASAVKLLLSRFHSRFNN